MGKEYNHKPENPEKNEVREPAIMYGKQVETEAKILSHLTEEELKEMLTTEEVKEHLHKHIHKLFNP